MSKCKQSCSVIYEINTHNVYIITSLYSCILCRAHIVWSHSPAGPLSTLRLGSDFTCFSLVNQTVSTSLHYQLLIMSSAAVIVPSDINCKSPTALRMPLIDAIVRTAPQDRTGM